MERFIQVELKNAELEHEFRMTKLKFEQQIYLDDTKNQIYSDETEQMRQQLSEIKAELEALHQVQLNNLKVEAKKPQLQNILPEEYSTRLAAMLNEYLALDCEPCSIEEIEHMEAELDELTTEIDEWSTGNGVDLSKSAEMKVLKGFSKDVAQSLSCFEEEEDTELTLEFDKKWKRKINEWLETT